jgi:hypothetical protein
MFPTLYIYLFACACRDGSRQDEIKVFHTHFEHVRTVPTLELKEPACNLLISTWTRRQPAAAAYFAKHCFAYEWMRVETGNGIPDDNNGKQLSFLPASLLL